MHCFTEKARPEAQEKLAIQEFISNFDVDFSTSDVMSVAVRIIEGEVYNHIEYIITNPDEKIISWTSMEYTLFKALEHAKYGEIITKGFRSVDEFYIVV